MPECENVTLKLVCLLKTGLTHFSGRSENRMVIWGTDVVVEDCREKFMKFLQNYICREFDSQGTFLEEV